MAQAHANHGSGGEVVEDDVGPLDKSVGDGHACLGREVDVDRSTAGADLCVLAAAFGIEDVVLEWADDSQGVEAGGAFDVHDVGAEVGECLDRLWSDHEPAEVGDLDAFQRPGVRCDAVGGCATDWCGGAGDRFGRAGELGEHLFVVLSEGRRGIGLGWCRVIALCERSGHADAATERGMIHVAPESSGFELFVGERVGCRRGGEEGKVVPHCGFE